MTSDGGRIIHDIGVMGVKFSYGRYFSLQFTLYICDLRLLIAHFDQKLEFNQRE